MANDISKKLPGIDKAKENIQDSIDKMYLTLYNNDNQIPTELEYQRKKVHTALDKLTAKNISNTGMTNISTLYSKSVDMDLQNDKSVIGKIQDTFENDSVMNNIMSTYSQNSYLRDLDNEIRMVCKYMPKLEDALETRKEHVLSADHYSKTNFKIKNVNGDAKESKSDSNLSKLRDKYEIDDLINTIYKDSDMMGEAFIYIVPYKKALQKLLNDTKDISSRLATNESTYNLSVSESVSSPKDININLNKCTFGTPVNNTDGFDVVISKSGIIGSAITKIKEVNDFKKNYQDLSLNEALQNDIIKEAKEDQKNAIGDEIKSSEKDFYKVDNLAADGIKLSNRDSTDKTELKVPGCIVKILDHTMVKPLYIDDMCLGYFYIECERHYDLEHTTYSSTLGGIRPGGGYRRQLELGESEDTQENTILKQIAQKISEKVDKTFINTNQDLAKEIYYILKYNRDIGATGKLNRMRITFIPPEDMVHSYFDMDKRSHRGVPALLKSLFPAKLYTCLYISNTLQILTRGNDKRVYYVKQAVDQNIHGVLLNVINQIQKSNFGLRQIESMNTVLNMSGRFNDMIIPKGPGGDAPIDMEVIPGQNVETKTDLMSMLEDMAINGTDVPAEVIQMRQQVDFATQLTMTNTKFLQKIYNRQARCQKIYNKVLTKIYDAEYECQDTIEMQLPPPMYLNLINTSQILDQADQLTQATVEMYAGDKDQGVQDIFKRKVKKNYVSSFLPEDTLNTLLNEAEMEFAKNNNSIEGNSEEQM
jgi:hypothetical protein